jgi:hypothetical protein
MCPNRVHNERINKDMSLGENQAGPGVLSLKKHLLRAFKWPDVPPTLPSEFGRAIHGQAWT